MYCTCMYTANVFGNVGIMFLMIVCVCFSSFENEINEKYNFLMLGQFLQTVLYACTHVHSF